MVNDKASQGVDRDLFDQLFVDIFLHFVELADGQAAADLGALAFATIFELFLCRRADALSRLPSK